MSLVAKLIAAKRIAFHKGKGYEVQVTAATLSHFRGPGWMVAHLPLEEDSTTHQNARRAAAAAGGAQALPYAEKKAHGEPRRKSRWGPSRPKLRRP